MKEVGVPWSQVSSRKVLQEVLLRFGVPAESFGPVCVIVDKIEKISPEKVAEELGALGLDDGAIQGILSAVKTSELDQLEELLGPGNEVMFVPWCLCIDELGHQQTCGALLCGAITCHM